MTTFSSVGGSTGGTAPASPQRGVSNALSAKAAHQIFARIDASGGSGGITPVELQKLISDAGPKLATATATATASNAGENGNTESAFSAMDSNADGRLSKGGLTDGLQNQLSGPSDTLSFVRSRSGAGGAADHDGDGPHGPQGPPPGGAGPAPAAAAASSASSANSDPLSTNSDGTVSAQEHADGAIRQAMKTAGSASNSATQPASGKPRETPGSSLQRLADPPLANKVSVDGTERPPNYRAMAMQQLRSYALAAPDDTVSAGTGHRLSAAARGAAGLTPPR